MDTVLHIFPLAFGINTFSMTGFMVILGLSGKLSLSADFGIVQSATMALFYAFSANARSLILNPSTKASVGLLVLSRLSLVAPLGAASLFLSANLGGVHWTLALILILRRCTEWIAELHLSEMEFRGQRSLAKVFIVTHSLLFLVALVSNIASDSFSLMGIAVWAVMPIALHLRFVRRSLSTRLNGPEKWVNISPQFGSTAITGVTVYVFRLFILLLVGKALAGSLYTAYAIGGFAANVYVNALGPTLVHRETLHGELFSPRWLKMSLSVIFLAGLSVFVLAEGKAGASVLFAKPSFFWSATGLSMMGGSLMVLAQRIRIGFLQQTEAGNVFGLDLIINLMIIAVVPFAFYLYRMEALKMLYLFSSVVTFVFYSVAKGRFLSRIRGHFSRIPDLYLKVSVAFVLVFPLFFQLTGRIFDDKAYAFDTQGMLTLVPIPISVFACFGGLLLIGSYERAKLSVYVIFITFVLMLGTTIISSKGDRTDEQAKLILLIQFILPYFGLALGQMYEGSNSRPLLFERTAVFVLLLIVPAQLIASYLIDVPLLYSHLYFFSIYQNLQYVSVIFVCLYLLGLFSLGKNRTFRALLTILGPLMAVYAVISASILAVFALVLGLVVFMLIALFEKPYRFPVLLVLLIGFSLATSFYCWKSTFYYSEKYSFFSGTTSDHSEKTPLVEKNVPNHSQNHSLLASQTAEEWSEVMPNASYRLRMWRFYVSRIFSDIEKFLFGHGKRPDRALFPSAHNYYLDIIYNFGFVATIPVIGLLVLTISRLFHSWREVIRNSATIGLAFASLFLLLIDNSLKVGLRQPYPGIITFFLWGMLLSRLKTDDSLATALPQKQKPSAANPSSTLIASSSTENSEGIVTP